MLGESGVFYSVLEFKNRGSGDLGILQGEFKNWFGMLN